MPRKCRECLARHRLQRKLLVNEPGMHHGTCVTHVSWCMSGSLTRGGRENISSIPGACANCNSAYLARGPWRFNTGNPHHLALSELHIRFSPFISLWFDKVTQLTCSCFNETHIVFVVANVTTVYHAYISIAWNYFIFMLKSVHIIDQIIPFWISITHFI